MQEPAADIGKPPRRREPRPVPGLGRHLVDRAGHANGAGRHHAAYQPRSHSRRHYRAPRADPVAISFQYVHQHQSLYDIAKQAGFSRQTLTRLAAE